MKNIISVLLLALFILTSCGSIQRLTISTKDINIDDYKNTKNEKSKNIPQETGIEIVTGGNIDSKPIEKTLLFKSVGETHKFKKGDIVEVVTQGIDFEDNTFYYTYEKGSDLISLSLQPRKDCHVKLQNKCEVLTWNDPNNIPNITVAEDINPEQVILTPLFNNGKECERVGYQIRYGSVERGCLSVAKDVLEQFNNCVGRDIHTPQIKTSEEPISIYQALVPQQNIPKRNHKKN